MASSSSPSSSSLKSSEREVNFKFIASPSAWANCFSLLYDVPTNKRRKQLKLGLFMTILVLVAFWTWMYWELTFSAGEFIQIVSEVLSGNTSKADALPLFNDLVWQTVVKMAVISITYGGTITCHQRLATIYRIEIMERFRELQFGLDGVTLWATSSEVIQNQADIGDLPELAIDVHTFTHYLFHMIFGSLYYIGFFQVFIALIVFGMYVIDATGQSSGIALCFGVFGFCLILELVVSWVYTRNVSGITACKTSIHRLVHSLLEYAESIALFRAQLVELRTLLIKLTRLYHLISKHAIWFMTLYFPVGIMMQMGPIVTFALPSVLYFFLHPVDELTPGNAATYLGIISFYGYLFSQMSNVLQNTEAAMHALTIGTRIHSLKMHMIRATEAARNRLNTEQDKGLRTYKDHIFELRGLDVAVPDLISGGEKILQRNLSVSVKTGECLLITGESGCGKTSLFRICAGLWPVISQGTGPAILLPRNVLFVPQKPYVPLGSLKTQIQLLVQQSTLTDDNMTLHTSDMTDEDVITILKLVQLEYLVPRFGLHTPNDWSSILSIGEMQRLGFGRILALCQFGDESQKPALFFFDESSSALDLELESQIYSTLQKNGMWFVTISHRQSLAKFHKWQLELPHDSTTEATLKPCVIPPQMYEDTQEKQSSAESLSSSSSSSSSSSPPSSSPASSSSLLPSNTFSPSKPSNKRTAWRNIRSFLANFYEFLMFPYEERYQSSGLKQQIWLVAVLSLVIVTSYSISTYYTATYTSDVYAVFEDFISGKIDVAGARDNISSGLPALFGLFLGSLLLFTIQIGIGRILAALLTHKQTTHIASTLLDDNTIWHCRQHGSNIVSEIPSVLSSDLVDFNLHLGQLFFGTIYHNGFLSVIALCIPYTMLLYENGGATAVAIVYIGQVVFSSLVLLVDAWFAPKNRAYLSSIAKQAHLHRRVDMLAEQIAISNADIQKNEANRLKTELLHTEQIQLGVTIPYGIFVAIANLAFVCGSIVSFIIPAAILLHSPEDDFDSVSVLTVSVFASYLQGNLANLSYLNQQWSFMRAIGSRSFNSWSLIKKMSKKSQLTQQLEESYLRRYSDDPEVTFDIRHINTTLTVHDKELTLIRDLNMKIPRNVNLLISGPSGCGKSTFIRMLAGLQSAAAQDKTKSKLIVPPKEKIIYIAQRVYVIEGTLSQVLQYLSAIHAEHSPSWRIKFDRADCQLLRVQDMQNALDRVGLGYLPARHGWNTFTVWSRVLSSGEQQRLMIASAMLSPASCIVLDESTAACDSNVEREIFKQLLDANKQFISVSHRPELRQFHTHELQLPAATFTQCQSHTTNRK